MATHQTTSRGGLGYLAATTFLLLSALAAREMRLGETSSLLVGPFEIIGKTNVFPSPLPNVPLRSTYTGILSLDFTLKYLVAAFLPGVAGWDKGFQVQQIYFLVSFFAVLGLWSIEAGRVGARGFLKFTTIWAIFYQTVGGAVVIPFYYIAYMHESSRKEYWTVASRQIPTAYSKALLPALVLGYLIPTIAMYLPFSDPDLYLTQGLVAFWQPSPLWVNLLSFLFTSFFGKSSAEFKGPDRAEESKYLNRIYLTLFAVSAAAHSGTIITCLISGNPQLSITRALGLIPSSERGGFTGGLHYIFQVDYWIIFTTVLGGAFLSVWDVKRLGVELSLLKSLLGMGFGVLFVGPAATVVGVAWIKEGALRGVEKAKK